MYNQFRMKVKPSVVDLWHIGRDRDPAANSWQDANKLSFFQSFLKIYFHQSSKIKSQKNVTKQKSRLSYLLCLLMEGYGSRSRYGFVQIMTDPDLGDPKTYGYGSGSTALVKPVFQIRNRCALCMHGEGSGSIVRAKNFISGSQDPYLKDTDLHPAPDPFHKLCVAQDSEQVRKTFAFWIRDPRS